MRTSPLVLLALLGSTTLQAETPPAAPAQPAKLLTAPEIIKRMEASPVHYRILTASKAKVDEDQFAALLWPLMRPQIDRPMVKRDAAGHAQLARYTLSPALTAKMEAAENLYETEHFDRAAALFEEVLKADPKCYTAHLYLGDCAYALHDLNRALKHYQLAVELNPDDYQTSFFLGDALFEQQRYREAVDAYTNALVNRPGYRPLIESLIRKARTLGITVHDDLFTPHALARKHGKDVDVILSDDAQGNAAWLAYAMCKALWIGEPSHRKELGVKEGTAWSSLEERECLANLGAVYLSGRQDESVSHDAALDRLTEAGHAGLLDAFTTYEVAGRLDPNVTLTLSEADRARVREYIHRFILVPWADEQAVGSP